MKNNKCNKYISFSFDDGRKDTALIAYPILSKHGFTCTVNMITDFITNPTGYSRYGLREPMSVSDVVVMQQNGNEIACHGHTHDNSYDDICDCITVLDSWGINVQEIGFASPFSRITPEKIGDVKALLDEKKISYIRTGKQIRREGYFYSVCMFLCEMFGLKSLFAQLNKSLIYSYPIRKNVILGVSITNKTTVQQIVKLIDLMPEQSSIVLIFHSILDKNDCYDRWCWDKDEFELLCEIIAKRQDCQVVNTNKLFGDNNDRY